MARVVAARGERWSRNRGGRGAGGDSAPPRPGAGRSPRAAASPPAWTRRSSKLSSASAKFVAGSPAAGLVAIAQLARSRGGRTRTPGGGSWRTPSPRRTGRRARLTSRTSSAARRARGGSSPRPRPNSRTTRAARRARSRCEPRRFCSARPRAATRNVVMAWAAAARARAARLSDEVNALRFEQAEAEAAAMVAAEAAAMVAAEAAAETKATAESEKKAAKSKSFLSAFRGPSRKSTDKKSFVASPNDDSGLSASPSAKSTARRPARRTLRDDAGDGVPVALAASVARIVRDVSAPTGKVPSVDEAERRAKPAAASGADAGSANLRRVFVRQRVTSGAGVA